jgi:hypothetical protein
MKKMFMIAVCVAASGFLFAQSAHFGLKAGVNISSLHQNGVDFNSRTGFYAGGLAHIHVSPHLAVQPEVYFSSQGAKSNANTYALNYVNVPVLVQYMAGNGFRLQTGPQLELLVSAKSETNGLKTDVKDSYNTAVFAWTFGASYQFPKTGVGVDARYNLGISDVNDQGPGHMKDRVVALGLFYQFQH